MALFLHDISTAKIMILGRWSSNAFLVYIRVQVLEWTNNMSQDMIQLDSFFDVAYNPYTSTNDPVAAFAPSMAPHLPFHHPGYISITNTMRTQPN